MKKNGKSSRRNYLRAFSAWALLCCCLISGIALCGCRSSRNTIQETTTVEHTEFTISEQSDTTTSEQTDSAYRRETDRADSGQRGVLSIERDSAGRPVFISWDIYSHISLDSKTMETQAGIFTLRNTSNNTKHCGSMDSNTQKTEETKTEISPSIPLETLFGAGIVLLVILYLIYILIDDILIPWIKKRKK